MYFWIHLNLTFHRTLRGRGVRNSSKWDCEWKVPPNHDGKLPRLGSTMAKLCYRPLTFSSLELLWTLLPTGPWSTEHQDCQGRSRERLKCENKLCVHPHRERRFSALWPTKGSKSQDLKIQISSNAKLQILALAAVPLFGHAKICWWKSYSYQWHCDEKLTRSLSILGTASWANGRWSLPLGAWDRSAQILESFGFVIFYIINQPILLLLYTAHLMLSLSGEKRVSHTVKNEILEAVKEICNNKSAQTYHICWWEITSYLCLRGWLMLGISLILSSSAPLQGRQRWFPVTGVVAKRC